MSLQGRGVVPSALGNPLAQYDFVQGADPTLLYDRSGNSNHGTLGLSGSFTPAYTAGGMNFGTASLVVLPAGVTWSNTSTILAWADAVPGTAGVGTVFGFQGGNPVLGIQTQDGRPGLMASAQGDPAVMGMRRYASGAGMFGVAGQKFYVNGAEVANYWIPPASYTPSGSTLWLGASNGGFFFQGSMYYLGVWNRVLSAAEVAAANTIVQAILATRGVSAVLSPVSSSTRRLLYIGDSITRGYTGGTGGFPRLVTPSLTHTYSPTNLGIGGYTMQAVAANGASFYAPLLTEAPAAQNCVVIMLGSNDITFGITTAAGTYANLTAFCTDLKSLPNPPKIVVVTMLPRAGTDAARAIYNGLITVTVSPPYDVVANWGGDATMGQNGQQADATNYADGVHPTDAAGYPIGAGYVATAINSVG